MRTFRGLLVLFCALAIVLSGAGFSLAADEETEPEPTESEEATEEPAEKPKPQNFKEDVTVTATRVESSLMKTPVAVSAFDQDTLDREGVKDIADMAQMVPNMDIATINGQSTPIISMRGVRSTNETELGDPAVGVHLDGIYSPRMQGVLALMFDNERVEILRGPQGTLFGRNSTVGSINIVTAKPKLQGLRGKCQHSYGNYNSREAPGHDQRPGLKINLRFVLRAGPTNAILTSTATGTRTSLTNASLLIWCRTPILIARRGFVECKSPRVLHANPAFELVGRRLPVAECRFASS